MRAIILVMGLMLLSHNVFADGWLYILDTNDEAHKYYAQKGSFEMTKNKAGDPISAVTGRVIDTSTSMIELQKWYVRDADCDAKQGELVTLKLDGTFLYNNDFIFGAGSVASGLAQFICSLYFYEEKQNEKKGM